ncbi:MAG: Rieske 2Fe-2S domain-containing protein [Rhodoferax sp.]|nr:Rieske 2Fe-2S domain-containing protein [Rhodoferax sp.]
MEPRHWQELPNAPAPGTELGSLQALPDGQATMHALDTASPEDKPFRVLLLRSGQRVRAFVNRCAHFGVPLAERQDLLIFQPHTSITCNVHYARYRWDDGVCIAGDCEGESLLPIPVKVDDAGRICIASGE